MNKVVQIILVVLIFFTSACNQKNTGVNVISIIPKPENVKPGSGYFQFNHKTTFFVDGFNELQNRYIEELQEESKITIQAIKEKTNSNCIELKKKEGFLDEEYRLTISEKNIVIYASTRSGAYYALQSIKQLINSKNKNSKGFLIPCVDISDKPAFAYRGMMLDHSRHFQPLHQLKALLDQMAYLKLNRFHMHLSDDTGFRVEIESYPKLNTIGSWRVDRNAIDDNTNNVWGRREQQEGEIATYGGYYTKEEIRELIEYAEERNIKILPEIDVPGHARAIIASYPEIACTSGNIYVAPGWSRANNTMCPSNEKTYEIMDAVFKEIAELFPYEYIHVGGDECYRHYWDGHDECANFMKKHNMHDNAELQSYFIHRMEKTLNKYGKKMIGWDEILDGGLAKNATVMSWRGESGGIKSAQMGHDVIMSPNAYHYIDLKQGQADFEPNLGYGFLSLSKTYSYKVIPDDLSEDEAKHILGTQANLWTENLDSWDNIMYMTYPRLFAVAENAWTKYAHKNWEDFLSRLSPQVDKLDEKGIQNAKSIYRPWMHHKGGKGTIDVWFTSEIPNSEIRYTLDASTPNRKSPLVTDNIVLDKTSTVSAGIFRNGKLLGPLVSKEFFVHKAANCDVLVNGKQQKNSKLTDLSYGQFLIDGDNNWLRSSENFWIEVKFEKETDVKEVRIRTQRHTLKRWYAASQIQVFTRENDQYQKIGDSGFMAEQTLQGRNLFENRVACNARGVKSIFVKVLGSGKIPEGHVNVGHNKVISVDEIIVL